MTAPARTYPRLAPWWTPWGAAIRLPRVVRTPSDVVWAARIGWFIARLPANVQRSNLSDFLGSIAKAPRPRAHNPHAAVERVLRLRAPWLCLPRLRTHDTCYVRALTLYRFLDAPGHEVRIRVGAEWFDKPGGVLRGHAWVTLDGETLEAPLGLDDHAHLQLIELQARSG